MLRPGEQCELPGGRVAPITFWWLAIKGSAHSTLPGMADENWQQLRNMLTSSERRCFDASLQLPLALDELYEAGALAPEVRQLATQTATQRILVQLLRDGQSERLPPMAPEQRAALRRAVQTLNVDLHDPPAWSAFAASAGWPAARLWQLFKKETGYSPTEYLNVRRIAKATRLMRERRLTNTEVAHALGFSTSQYFAVVFRRLHGMTPTQYLKRTDHGATR
jgi:AraC-like DNA-binding protein